MERDKKLEKLRKLLIEKYGITNTDEIEKMVSEMMPHIEINIVERGVDMEAKMNINGLKFVTQRGLETKEAVLELLKEHKLEKYMI